MAKSMSWTFDILEQIFQREEAQLLVQRVVAPLPGKPQVPGPDRLSTMEVINSAIHVDVAPLRVGISNVNVYAPVLVKLHPKILTHVEAPPVSQLDGRLVHHVAFHAALAVDFQKLLHLQESGFLGGCCRESRAQVPRQVEAPSSHSASAPRVMQRRAMEREGVRSQ
eukprot:CAMPEP_0168365686 /NCGR_PEP_ID=MMETSP0228-20121227/4845_1 /TAXON_ID=133427 /ORGANISM="Protoceratium reticulatum, Strain CCCM 535 (=CCMP 1889)" /LENGTH=166 /DNA_ID=CAMNT_0008378473 /DNA_START=346 /DNA_END=843 /DNA_ORIENTATION=+